MKRLVIATSLFFAFFANCHVANAQQKSIVDTAIAAGNFNTLVAAVRAAGLADALNGSEPMTVFAPTDEAFEKLDPLVMQSLLDPSNREKLKAILTYHVVPGRVVAADAYGMRSATSLQGQRLYLNLQDDEPSINTSRVTATDIMCSNGVIHVIDEVMISASNNIPETASNAGVFNTLVTAVGAADLVEVLGGEGPFTVFAPTDEAFAKLPEGTVESLLLPENKHELTDILKYHVVAGRVYDDQAVKAGSASTLLTGRNVRVGFSAAGLKVNDANIVSKNVETSNGVIHVIDRVLLPSVALSRTGAMAVLQSAVDRGVPVFNDGDHAKCCKIYTAAMEEVKGSGIEGMQNYVSTVAASTMSDANGAHSDADRAWALRRGIDNLRSRLQEELSK